MAEYQTVISLDGLFDETKEASVYDINERKWCWRVHDWINAHLQWKWHVKNRGAEYGVELGNDKNGVWPILRFCRRCKLIDCPHLFKDRIMYRIDCGDFAYTTHLVEHCYRCNCRILIGGSMVCEPDPEASIVIAEAAVLVGTVFPGNGWGSGWHCEFPVAVSSILKYQGRDAAIQYAAGMFRRGDCSASRF